MRTKAKNNPDVAFIHVLIERRNVRPERAMRVEMI